jgi:hypothetical protein
MRSTLIGLVMLMLIILLSTVMPELSKAGTSGTGSVCPAQVINPGGGSVALRGTIAVDMYDSVQLAGCPGNCPTTATGDVIVRLSRGGSEAFFRTRLHVPLASNTAPDYLATLCAVISDPTTQTAILQQLAPGKSTLAITNSSVQDFDGPPNVNDSPLLMYVPNLSDSNRHIISMSDVTVYAQ